METIIMIILIVLLAIALVLLFIFRNDINKRFAEYSALQRETIDNLRQELNLSMEKFKQTTDDSNTLSRELLREKFEVLDRNQKELLRQTSEKLEMMRRNSDEKMESMRNNVGDKLELIRSTVDEKLEKTLSDRLGKSFETVGKQLIEVQKGLGEMQNLAQDVGGLKKVLSNVKMRGGLGEVQLAMLLEQILAPGQYEANVHIRPRSQQVVEYAVKLPGKDDEIEHIWLPIDAKFPRESYEKLQAAYDLSDSSAIETERNSLYRDFKKMAADIRDKYILPPYTTDFAIMFLPFEGIYAEAVRSATLLQELQSQYKVIITGPTTLAALLNSLQMGFRTLAIQKRSSEVWKVLAGVKKEFETFGNMLAKAKKNIQGGLDTIDDLAGVRTRQIQSKLRKVEGDDDDVNLLEENEIKETIES